MGFERQIKGTCIHRERKPESVTGIVAGPVLVLSVDVFLERIAKCQLTARLKQIHQSVSKNQSHRGLSLSRRGLKKKQVGRSRLVSRTRLGQPDKPWDSAFITFSGF